MTRIGTKIQIKFTLNQGYFIKLRTLLKFIFVNSKYFLFGKSTSFSQSDFEYECAMSFFLSIRVQSTSFQNVIYLLIMISKYVHE